MDQNLEVAKEITLKAMENNYIYKPNSAKQYTENCAKEVSKFLVKTYKEINERNK